MSDFLGQSERSQLMSRVKNRDTKIETTVRSLLHRRGFRFRKNVKSLPGKPDIVLPKYKAVILIHGCFWHGHTCNKGKIPSTNVEFWFKKIVENKKRDKSIRTQLQNSGWRFAVVWECSLKNKVQQKKTIEQLCEWIKSITKYIEIPRNLIGK